MESENGVAMEDEKHVIGETTKENINKGDENNDNAEIETKNGVSQPAVEAPDGHNSAVSTKNSKRAKVPPYTMYHTCLSSNKLLMVEYVFSPVNRAMFVFSPQF